MCMKASTSSLAVSGKDVFQSKNSGSPTIDFRRARSCPVNAKQALRNVAAAALGSVARGRRHVHRAHGARRERLADAQLQAAGGLREVTAALAFHAACARLWGELLSCMSRGALASGRLVGDLLGTCFERVEPFFGGECTWPRRRGLRHPRAFGTRSSSGRLLFARTTNEASSLLMLFFDSSISFFSPGACNRTPLSRRRRVRESCGLPEAARRAALLRRRMRFRLDATSSVTATFLHDVSRARGPRGLSVRASLRSGGAATLLARVTGRAFKRR